MFDGWSDSYSKWSPLKVWTLNFYLNKFNKPFHWSKIPEQKLFYISGYVTRHDDIDENELLQTTTMFYYEKYGQFTKDLDRGGLKIPTDKTCQWVNFCFLLFNAVRDRICRRSLSCIFLKISKLYSFDMTRKNAEVLSNIFISNYCRTCTPRSGKEPSQKILKLKD